MLRSRYALAAAAVSLALFLLGACMPTGTPVPTIPPRPAATATAAPTPAPTPAPTISVNPPGTPVPGSTRLAGRVWHDLCAAAPAPTAGCIGDAQSGYRGNGVIDPGETGISGVQVGLGAGDCPSSGLATASTDAEGRYAFAGMPPGKYCVMINGAVAPNAAVLMPGQWTRPQAAERATYAITLNAGEQRVDLDFGWDYQNLPAVPTPQAAACTLKATYVADVTVPDNSVMAPGAAFSKTWRVRNDGTCTWGSGTSMHTLKFSGGSRMDAPESVQIGNEVKPGKTTEISVPFIAPGAAGAYRSEWKLADDSGRVIGFGAGNSPLYVQITVRAVSGAPTRITFAAGATEATVSGSVATPNRPAYLLRALAGQQMIVTVTSPANAVNFAVVGVSDGQPYKRVENESRCMSAMLTTTQDYRIDVAVLPDAITSTYSLKVIVLPPGQTNPAPCGGM